MHASVTLERLRPGDKAKVSGLRTEGTARRRLLDLGFVCGSIIEALQKSPAGDPTAYLVKGAVIALRAEDASKIDIQPI